MTFSTLPNLPPVPAVQTDKPEPMIAWSQSHDSFLFTPDFFADNPVWYSRSKEDVENFFMRPAKRESWLDKLLKLLRM